MKIHLPLNKLRTAGPPPPGTYVWRILELEPDMNSAGTRKVLRAKLEVASGPQKGREIRYTLPLESFLEKTAAFLEASGLLDTAKEEGGATVFDLESARRFEAELTFRTGASGTEWPNLDHFERLDEDDL